MSWPQWPGNNLGQPSMVQPTVINPAPNVVNPSANQYTPEQWAQMQHQNWQQWAQWQQQFQQWQQQYGAEYQKSMNAIAQAAIPPQASVPFMPAPPLPAESKPPPPPDEPAAPPQSTTSFGMNVLPPTTQPNYNTAPPPPQPPQIKSGFDNKYPSYRNTVPPNQAAFPNQDVNSPQRFNRNQNYNREPQSQNWQNQNRNQQSVNRFNHPPPRVPQFENKPDFGAKRPYFNPNDIENTKRNKIDETNKWDGNPQQNNREETQRVLSQQKPPAQAQPQAKSSNPEELSEAEKKFDKQFNDWEAQFQKWKEQNANHPDKEQYRQYEKKWETWRAQLLERREQMKRKRLGLSLSSPQQPVTNKPDQEPRSSSQPSSSALNANVEPTSSTADTQVNTLQEIATEKLEVPTDVPIIRPPPNLNNEPLEFKQSSITIIESSDQKQVSNKDITNPDTDQNDFLKSSASDGIPGLDLVKETADNEEEDSNNKMNDNGKPDLEAISRGINSILGDQKLLNMLSIVSQNQNKVPQPPPKMDSPKFSPTEENIQEENQYSNEVPDEYFSFEKPPFNDEISGNQSQSRSDSQMGGDDYYPEEGSNSYGDSRHFPKGPDNFTQFSGPRNLEKQSMNRNQNFMQDVQRDNNFNRGPSGNNFRNYNTNSTTFNRINDNYDQPNRDVDNVSRGNFTRNRNQGNEFDQFNKGLDSFSQDKDDTNAPLNSYNRGSDGFGRGSDNFNRGLRGPGNFNRGPGNFNRGSDNFNRGPGNLRGQDNFNKGPINFNRGPANFNRGSDNFNKGPDNFNKGPDNFNKGPDIFNRGPDNFNKGPDNFSTGPDNFNKGLDNFNKGADNFNKGLGNFNKGPDSFNKGPDNFNKGPNRDDNFNRGPENFNRGPENFNRGPDNFNRGPDNFKKGLDNFNRGPENFSRGPDSFNRGPDHFNRRPDNFNRGSDVFNRGPGNFSRGLDNFNRGPEILSRGSDSHAKGPDNFKPGNFRESESFSSGHDNFNRDFDDVTKHFDNSGEDPEMYSGSDNFGTDSERFHGPDHADRGSDKGFDSLNRGSDKFNRGCDNLARGQENFNRVPNNFNRDNVDRRFGNKNFENFNRGHLTHEKGPNINKGHSGRESIDLNREAEDYDRPPNFIRAFPSFDKNLDSNFSRGPENFYNRPPEGRPPLLSNRSVDRDVGHFDNCNRMVSPGSFDKGPNSSVRGPIPFNKKPELIEGSSFNQNTQFNVKEDNIDANSWKSTAPRGEPTFDDKLVHRSNAPEKFGDEDANTFGKAPEELGAMKRNLSIDIKLDSTVIAPPVDPLPKKNQSESNGAEGIWKTSNVIDYGHKSLADEPEVILEVFHTFDYRHKPLNRIPYPSRPKWLSEMVDKYPEFDLGGSRNPRHELRKNEKFDSYNTFDSRGKIPFDDWSRRNIGDRDNYIDRDRKFPEDRKRKPYDDRERYSYDEKERPAKEYRTDKGRRGSDRDEVLHEEKDIVHGETDKNRVFDEQKSTDSSKARHSKAERVEDEDYFENEDHFTADHKHNETSNMGNDKQGKAKSVDKNPTYNSTKSNITSIEDLLTPPGRYNRPPRIVIILRGPPGSGKSFLAKLIKDKEVENGGSAPRILCLDDYFMVEQEKEVEEDGRKTKIKEMVYEYEEDMEASYRQSLMKSFKKTITDGYFTFIIVDNINDKVKYFGEMWSFAKQNGFQVYICQMELDVQNCTKRNIHGRSESEIEKCVASWEPTPSHHPVLDATSLIQSGSIPEVEMEEINSPSSDNMNEEDRLISSKWDAFDYSLDNLAKLDGTNKPLRTSRTMEDYLQLDDDWVQPVSTKPGQKRVRWADLEERKEQEKMRAIGFVVGQTNWDRMMDPTMGGSALTQTKYIERYSKY